ncbi:MAG: biotin--[acetyl-CoA-carboxylase] ligase [Butyrivibrio sp.]|nr:biotin--[acetyl-CoA-carboxylase] ligase [Butyrivibrio sp.]
MLSKEHISEQLHTRWAAANIWYKDITDSTNDDAKRLAEEGAPHGMLVVADKQEQGRGSRGRSWETPAGVGIAMSLIVRPKVPIECVSMLTLVMGLSVAEGAEQAINESISESSFTCNIKWPNDVILADRKICGILTELHMEPSGEMSDVVIGVGINVNMARFPEDIKDVAGSLLTGCGRPIDRSLVVARVMERFEENYEKFEKTHDLSLLKDQYEKRLVNKGLRVMLLDTRESSEVKGRKEVEQKFAEPDNEQGEALGITDKGELIVRMDDGEVREVTAGDVSVRGLYGYV